ncbi:MAG: aminotransferase class III-fold pyridoxal phosphate-dependent enzyme, partial [Spirochaetales bacterium]|nr:aminotransferase class III-fold pyridoxal phosphate-dependent enzyme [Spirochaetales bacterium]
GRTGRLYSYMNFDIVPDVVSTAKGLGGGLPLGATLISDKCKNVLGFGDHGSTFGGNPVCCAGALSILSRIDDSLLYDVRAKSDWLFREFSHSEGIESVSGMGLMIGLKTKKPASEVVEKCIENGVLCLTAKDKVRLLPALNIPMETLKQAASIIKAACR